MSVIDRFHYLKLRLFIAILLATIIIIVDTKINICFPFQNYIENVIYWFYDLYDKTDDAYHYVFQIFAGYQKLILENDSLKKELFLKNSELLLLDQYKQENHRLYELLNSPVCCNNKRRLITKIFLTDVYTCNQQAIINKGSYHDVYVGQPVISDIGVIGQVISVNEITSRVLLISDPSHALSVKISRNNIRMILMGRGPNAALHVKYPGNIDIYVNDILVTSGLDGRFPEGYPVAIVSNISFNLKEDYTIIEARPTFSLKSLRYVVLIWG